MRFGYPRTIMPSWFSSSSASVDGRSLLPTFRLIFNQKLNETNMKKSLRVLLRIICLLGTGRLLSGLAYGYWQNAHSHISIDI